MKRVPSASAGAARRSYHSAYSKGSTAVVSNLLGGRKLSTPKVPAPQQKTSKQTEYGKPSKDDFNVSFGNTGFVEDL